MERRRFLARAGAGAVAVTAASGAAGCLDQVTAGYPETPAAPDAVADWSFETRQPEAGDPDPESKPSVACDVAESEVRIEGVMYSGTPCDAVAPESIAFEDGEFEFTLAVFDGVESGPCGDVLTSTHYRATVGFADALPERVATVESIEKAYGETRRRAADCRPR